MSSPFADSSRRIFACYGSVRDKFMSPLGIQLPFDAFLHRHLQALGYATILFYSHRGLYFYDQASHDRVIKGEPAVRSAMPAPLQPTTAPSLAPAPGGLTLRRGQQNQLPQSTPSPVDLHPGRCYPNLNRLTEILTTLQRLTAPGSQDIAVVFDSDHIGDFGATGPMTDQFRGFMERDLRILPASRRTILIFLFGMVLEQLEEELKQKPALSLLLNLGNNRQIQGIATPIHIGPPERDEVRRLVHYYRLRHDLAVEWKGLERNLLQLTAAIKTGELGARPGLAKRWGGAWLNDLDHELLQMAAARRPLDLDAVRAMTGHRVEQADALARLEAMAGLAPLKKHIRLKLKQRRHLDHTRSQGPVPPPTDLLRLAPPPRPQEQGDYLHIVLSGNPGTGKTTVAHLISEIYQQAGLLELGHTVKAGRDDLAAGYIGQTALKTRERIEEALGGVLFIDEAYSLVEGGENDYGHEVINTLIDAMHEYKDRLCVIFAGYPRDMDKLLASNAGFPRRVTRIELEDYEPAQLAEIFTQFASKAQPPATCDEELKALLPGFYQEMYDQRPTGFGNAGTIETLFDKMQTALIDELDTPAATHIFGRRHIPEEFQGYLDQAALRGQGGPLGELEALVGLRGVKDWFRGHIENIQFEQRRKPPGEGRPGIPLRHYLFIGNSGTGMRRVARLMAEQFRRMGLLKTAHLTEITASELAGQPWERNEKTVRERFMAAHGGVFFVDEAHLLAQQKGYGPDAMSILNPLLRKHANDLSVVFAGYRDRMEAMNGIDPGLKGRIEIVVFEDFTAEELVTVFRDMAHRDDFICAADVNPVLLELFSWMLRHKTSEPRNLELAEQVFERTRRQLARRVRAMPEAKAVDLNLIEARDLPGPDDCGDML